MFSRTHLYVGIAVWFLTPAAGWADSLEITGQADARELPYKYVGHNVSLKFHRPSCPFARLMNVRHLELFHFRKEAIEAKYSPCRYCLPPWWKSCSVRILPKQD